VAQQVRQPGGILAIRLAAGHRLDDAKRIPS
jgi:hypothetical protein